MWFRTSTLRGSRNFGGAAVRGSDTSDDLPAPWVAAERTFPRCGHPSWSGAEEQALSQRPGWAGNFQINH